MISVGDIVSPIMPQQLWAGAVAREPLKSYYQAVCVSTDPFVLASEDGCLIWKWSVYPMMFMVTGRADQETMHRCMEKFDKEYPDPFRELTALVKEACK